MEKLDAARIELSGVEVRVVERCASTNIELLSLAPALPMLLAAEAQTAGRGQRGRRWLSAAGKDVTFSLALRVSRAPRELAALSLVAGVATAQALRELGVPASLKWPNDLMVDGAKLGGILVETRAEREATLAVFGIGVNCCDARALERSLRRPVASLHPSIARSRNRLIGDIARALHVAVQRFDAEGFEPARGAWEALDANAGRRLRIRLSDGRLISGIGAGLAQDGALRLLTRGGERAVRSGRIVAARAG